MGTKLRRFSTRFFRQIKHPTLLVKERGVRQIIDSLPERERNIACNLFHSAPQPREQAISELVKIKSMGSIPLLELMLRSEWMSERRDAINALVKLGSTRSAPLIKKMLQDKETQVRTAADNALKRLSALRK